MNPTLYHARQIFRGHPSTSSHVIKSSFLAPRRSSHQIIRGHAAASSPTMLQNLSCLEAPTLSYARQAGHVLQVSEQLERTGMLKISLGFPDSESDYLKHLLRSLHEHHHHQLPISHSAKRGWFWDVRPSKDNFQAGSHQARSETMNNFPWHTDCSYESMPPRFFALQVLQHDTCGGGTLSLMNVEKLMSVLSSETRAALMAPEYQITIPPEFIKDPNQKHITGSILLQGPDHKSSIIRYREDILTPLTPRAAHALKDLKSSLLREDIQTQSTVHLKSTDLPSGSIVLMDNRRWLHARNNIKDPKRHLRRVRWDPSPFDFGQASQVQI